MTRKISEYTIHLLGVEDGSFKSFLRVRQSFTLLCGVETELNRIIGIRLTRIQVDGFDATEKFLGMIGGMEVDVIILGGITFAGFNIIDPSKILFETGIPVIVYSGIHPDNEKMLKALKKHFDDWHERWNIIERLGPVHCTRPHPRETPIYFEVIGCCPEWAEKILHRSAAISRIPEPVRVAGLIARGLSSVF